MELAKHNQEFHSNKDKMDRLNFMVNDLEGRYKKLEKKKKISDLNEQDALAKIIFLESESKRLKDDKDRIQNRDINDLKI